MRDQFRKMKITKKRRSITYNMAAQCFNTKNGIEYSEGLSGESLQIKGQGFKKGVLRVSWLKRYR